jgi:ornithine racemase
MAFITLSRSKLRENFEYLDALFAGHQIKWAVVSKLLCGEKSYLKELNELPITQVCDSRVSNLRMIKMLNPAIETIYIKPPAKRALKGVVEFADISFNTELDTIKMLSKEAQRQDKKHKIIIMIEMGELREGVLRDDLIGFYASVFKLPNIEVVGIGTNLSCLYGVLPNEDKLIQLSLFKQLIDATFHTKIPYVSGGSSVTIPLIFHHSLPKGINHFRVGETLFLGTDVYHDRPFDHMHNDVFRFYAEIIELIEKPMTPFGDMGTNLEGESFNFEMTESGETSHRAIIDIGILDVDTSHIFPVKENQAIIGASSDMIVIDLGENAEHLKVGNLIEFNLDYMGALRLLNSKYIEKKVVG